MPTPTRNPRANWIETQCANCGTPVWHINWKNQKRNGQTDPVCSSTCRNKLTAARNQTPPCDNCGTPLTRTQRDDQKHRKLDTYACSRACRNQLRKNSHPACDQCGKTLKAWRETK